MTVSTRLELSDVLEDRFADIFIIKDFTHTGATFDIASDYDVSISGYGDLKNISGLNQSAFNVQDGGKLQLANLNFSNFDTSISGNVVKVESGGILNVLDSSFTSNTGSGSAIVNNGTLSVKIGRASCRERV